MPYNCPDEFMDVYEYVITDYICKLRNHKEFKEADEKEALWVKKKMEYEPTIEAWKGMGSLFRLGNRVEEMEVYQLEVDRDMTLANMKSKFCSLTPKEAYKISKNFEGYASFKCFPLIHALAITTDGAKSTLYDEIIRIERTDTLGNELRSMQHRNNLLSQCMDIRDNTYAGNSKIKSTEETWKVFKKKVSKCLEYDLAIVAGLLIFFDIHKFKAIELDIMIAYSFYMNQKQREDFMYLVRKMLVEANIKAPYTMEYLLPLDFYSSSYDIELLGALTTMLSDYDVSKLGTLLL